MLTNNEALMIAKCYASAIELTISRFSEREFDLEIEAKCKDKKYVRSWLPLAIIKNVTDWSAPDIAKMTDYPEMTSQGDWSGVRDTRDEAIWNIMDTINQKEMNT